MSQGQGSSLVRRKRDISHDYSCLHVETSSARDKAESHFGRASICVSTEGVGVILLDGETGEKGNLYNTPSGL